MEKLAVPSMEEKNDNKVIINLRSSFIHIIPTRNSDSDVTISSKNNVFFSGTDSRLEMVFMQFFLQFSLHSYPHSPPMKSF